MNLNINQTIGNYRVVRLLGKGGMGSVYEVEHVLLGVHYAMKAFTLDSVNAERFRKRFVAEGKILARLNHPNLVRVTDMNIDEETGTSYFVMDLVLNADGKPKTLQDIRPGEVDEEQIFAWFRDICGALAYVHSQGIVHRDIKLCNMLLASDGRAILSDFGISKICDDDFRRDVDITKTILTSTGDTRMVMGTRGFVAPEVLKGEEATAASDVYSLAVAFFRLLTGVWYDCCMDTVVIERAGASTPNSEKLLEPFEYRWADVLPRMLSENPKDRTVNVGFLPDLIGENRVDNLKGSSNRFPIGRVLLLAGIIIGIAFLIVIGTVILPAGKHDDAIVGQNAGYESQSLGDDAEVDPGINVDDLYEIPEGVPE